MLHKKGGKNMKKRFTVMLEETTSRMLKKVALTKTPAANRDDIEYVLWQYAHDELDNPYLHLHTIEDYRKMMKEGKLPDDK